MSIDLIALLDDVAALAKVAAASQDDIAGQAAQAGAKAAGVVIEDTAVTPRYVTGFSAARELPIIGRIALGSLKNKLLFLLAAALVFSLLAPYLITPLLMIGGAYLCYEGVEKIYHSTFPHAAHAHEASLESIGLDAASFEDQKVAGAIKTDFMIHDAAAVAAGLLVPAGAVVAWLVEAAAAGLFGIAVRLIAIPAISHCVSPLWRQVRSRLRSAT